jgi:5-(carboxyamino)imidazole ribonucleotide synthase
MDAASPLAHPSPGQVVPPATVGMLGGGQLGRYALMAARTMGYRTVVLEPDAHAPAGAVADEHLVAAYDDPAALEHLARTCAVVTTEFENPPAAAMHRLAEATLVRPSASAVEVAQDRRIEKRTLAAAGVPVGPFAVVESDDDLATATTEITFPAILKTARMGYDGKGQVTVAAPEELTAAWRSVGGVPCVLEQRLALRQEVSVLVARSPDGSSVTYPLAENVHVDGILDLTVVPARVDGTTAAAAVGLATRIAATLGYVGVLAVEMFLVDDGAGGLTLLVNEIAPRPHNSGHWTLDGARTDQFAQQIRAVCGVGLASTEMVAPAAAMVNLLGDRWANGEPDWAAVLAHADAALHLYGKAEARPGRKMGHLTVLADSVDAAASLALRLRDAATR